MTYISELVGLCHLIVVVFENAALMCLLLEMQHHKKAPTPKRPAPISVTHLPPPHQAAYCGFLCNVKTFLYIVFLCFHCRLWTHYLNCPKQRSHNKLESGTIQHITVIVIN